MTDVTQNCCALEAQLVLVSMDVELHIRILRASSRFLKEP